MLKLNLSQKPPNFSPRPRNEGKRPQEQFFINPFVGLNSLFIDQSVVQQQEIQLEEQRTLLLQWMGPRSDPSSSRVLRPLKKGITL